MMHRTIFVDDSDTAINYGGSWKILQGVQTEGLSSGIPGQSPLYGTLHALDATAERKSWNITYKFNGTAVQAQFALSNSSAFVSCTVDGEPQTISTNLDFYQRKQCGRDNIPVGGGPHELFIAMQPNDESVLLDSIFVTPEPDADLSELDGDIQFILDDEGIKGKTDLGVSGDSVDIGFTGYSVSIYATLDISHSDGTSAMFYTVDGGEPFNFTVTNPSTQLNPGLLSQIIVQTPRLSLRTHKLHLELVGPGTWNQRLLPISLDMIIVQNTTSPKYPSLEAVPGVPTSLYNSVYPGQATVSSSTGNFFPTSLSEQTPGQAHRKEKVIIASVVTSIVVVIFLALIALYVVKRRRRSNSQMLLVSCNGNEITPTSSVFPTPYTYSNSASTTKQSKSHPATREINPYVVSNVREQVILRHHQDGGRIESTNNSILLRVVDVPPSYDAAEPRVSSDGGHFTTGRGKGL